MILLTHIININIFDIELTAFPNFQHNVVNNLY